MNKSHDFIYFYKENNDKIPIITGGSNDFNSIIFIRKDEKKAISKLLPKDKSLYVLVDGQIFKLL